MTSTTLIEAHPVLTHKQALSILDDHGQTLKDFLADYPIFKVTDGIKTRVLLRWLGY